MSVRVLSASLLVILPFFWGCGGGGEKTVKITGRLHNKGTPLKLQNKMAGRIDLLFYPVSAEGDVDPKAATVDENGNFELAGPAGQGLPAGKYKIVVYHFDPAPDDKLKGAFSEERSKIVRDIDENSVLDIDLSKPEGK